MFRITLPKDADGYKTGNDVWDKLHLSGFMRIEKHDDGWLIQIEPEKKVSLGDIERVLPKHAKVEEVQKTKEKFKEEYDEEE
ncbi:hypothetical protein SAMN02746089_02790 [Caldanaerobius fijiensis DSM 17918]|uniref:Uncharacterized protein n=1 Tax=Caldanaerobius fijiensis DSM 17918 TaxID=1121256 RepID=A0A1M5FQJ7_9THEO|nr:hypothetical protein [Caldanaerobius fijiensis]SHF93431.1 hypothetical protein SAMN02746089_02790 [Caldanaerobius fijiensis DSM 17918]